MKKRVEQELGETEMNSGWNHKSSGMGMWCVDPVLWEMVIGRQDDQLEGTG